LAEISLDYSAIFVGRDARFGFVPPGAGYPPYAEIALRVRRGASFGSYFSWPFLLKLTLKQSFCEFDSLLSRKVLQRITFMRKLFIKNTVSARIAPNYIS